MHDLKKSVLRLDNDSVLSHWDNRTKSLGKLVRGMAAMESTWALDEEDGVLDALDELIQLLNQTPFARIQEHGETLVRVMGYLESPRALRILEWLDQRYERDTVSVRLVAMAQEHPENRTNALLVARLQRLKSLELLGSVFSGARLRMLAELLRADTMDAFHH